MPESFLSLDAHEQSQIYRALAPQLARSPVVLEKDVWVCWVLQTLFTLPGRLPMAFKGGTSLSKIFGAIARFSEMWTSRSTIGAWTTPSTRLPKACRETD